MGSIYKQICSWDNLWTAYKNAARGKRGRVATAAFELYLADHLLELQSELQKKYYRPGSYHSFYIHEPKRRLISAAPFRDRVVHHALCNLTVPSFEKRLIADSYANRPGKGTHRALDRCQYFARRYRYVLQSDIVQFFPSIDHQILLKTLKKMLPEDPDLFWLIEEILESGKGLLSEEYSMVFFPGDDLFAGERPRGLPIGNLTSQWWANCYLSPLDHFIKRQLRCRAYLRYVDDFLLFSNCKKEIWTWKNAITDKLSGLRLTLHDLSAYAKPVREGIPFLGFVIFPTHRRLKRRKGIEYRRKLKRLIATAHDDQIQASLQGWINHVRSANTYGLRKTLLAELNLLAQEAQ